MSENDLLQSVESFAANAGRRILKVMVEAARKELETIEAELVPSGTKPRRKRGRPKSTGRASPKKRASTE